MDAAEVRLRRQIEVDQRLGRQANLSEDYRTLSHIYRSRQQVNEAELWVGKAVEIANRTMEQAKMADDYRELCDLSMATKRFDRAQQYL